MTKLSRDDIEDLYQLSPGQAGILFHALYAPASGTYLEQSSCRFRGRFNSDLFIEAWHRIVHRHAVLRTLFLWEGLEKPLQLVKRTVDLPVDRHDWRSLSSGEQIAALENFKRADRKRGFELTKAPLMRIALLQLADEVFQFVLSFHHLLLDGWAFMLVQEEVFSCYEALCLGRTPDFPDRRPYRDFISWLHKQDMSTAEGFWRNLLRGCKTVTPLMSDLRSHGGAVPDQHLREEHHKLSDATTFALTTMARRRQLTLNTVIQGAWALLLSRYSGQDEVLFGAVVSGRPADLAGAESIIGFFINTLPVRVQVNAKESLTTWLSRLQRQQIEARQYDYTPLVDIQGWSEVPRGQPLFESLVAFENYPISDRLSAPMPDLSISDSSFTENIHYPLTLVAIPGPELSLDITYQEPRFKREAIRRMLGHLQQLLEGMVRAPEQPVGALEMLTEEEREELLERRNATAAAYPADRCVHELFEEQVERSSEAVAVVVGQREVSYRELNERANTLAQELRELGVRAEARVGICMERSLEMIVGLLGIWKAGGAFVPLDSSYPRERLEYVIADAGIRLLLTQQSLRERLAGPGVRCLCLDAEGERFAAKTVENLRPLAASDNLAYVMYTSGSTGKPKGVLIPHQALTDHTMAIFRCFDLGPQDVTLQFASLNFDVALEEMLPTWLAGGTVVLQPVGPPPSAKEFFSQASRLRITVLNLPVSYWDELMCATDGRGPNQCPCLRLVVVGSERIDTKLLTRWEHLPERSSLLCAYGCTEATITSLIYRATVLPERDRPSTSAPLGMPIPGWRTYVLDEQMSPVPIGIPGELYLAGNRLARGFLNQPHLTAAAFVPDPFSHEPGARMFRTGDLVRYVSDAAQNLCFLGRTDSQVKIRGFRVELNEIEENLRTHQQVHAAVVLSRVVSGENRIVAYIVPKSGEHLEASQLRFFLRQFLPNYMIPREFILLNELPLTSGGKVDRRAIAETNGPMGGPETKYVAPRRSYEVALAKIWSEVLRLPRIGADDHFFELGGHSLLAMQIATRIQDQFEVQFRVKDVFDQPILSQQAETIEAAHRRTSGLGRDTIEAAPRQGPPPITIAQEQLWELWSCTRDTGYYNISTAARLRGLLNIEILERSLSEIARRHEVLRTRLSVLDGRTCQVVMAPSKVPLPIADLCELQDRQSRARSIARAWASHGFDLLSEPLWRVALVKLDEQDHVLLFAIHHIISDGWSTDVFNRELEILYAAYLEGSDSPLPELPLQYGDFARWQQLWLKSQEAKEHLDYWRPVLGHCSPVLQLPTDRAGPAVRSFRYSSCSLRVDQAQCEKLEHVGRIANASLFMTLLAAFGLLLRRGSNGEELILVGTTSVSRNIAALDRLIGLFANTLTLSINTSGDPEFHGLLGRVRDTTLVAFEHQELPFECILEMLAKEAGGSRPNLFTVLFNVHYTSRHTLRLRGIDVTAFVTDEEDRPRLLPSVLKIIVEVDRGESGMEITFRYDTDLFDQSTIAEMLRSYESMLSQIIQNPRKKLSEFQVKQDTSHSSIWLT